MSSWKTLFRYNVMNVMIWGSYTLYSEQSYNTQVSVCSLRNAVYRSRDVLDKIPRERDSSQRSDKQILRTGLLSLVHMIVTSSHVFSDPAARSTCQ